MSLSSDMPRSPAVGGDARIRGNRLDLLARCRNFVGNTGGLLGSRRRCRRSCDLDRPCCGVSTDPVGLGFTKTALEFGAFPVDCYSHASPFGGPAAGHDRPSKGGSARSPRSWVCAPVPAPFDLTSAFCQMTRCSTSRVPRVDLLCGAGPISRGAVDEVICVWTDGREEITAGSSHRMRRLPVLLDQAGGVVALGRRRLTDQRMTPALPPAARWCTSPRSAMEVSPGVVMTAHRGRCQGSVQRSAGGR